MDRLRLDYADDARVVSLLLSREELGVSELRGRVALLSGDVPLGIDETPLDVWAHPELEVGGVTVPGRAFRVGSHEVVALSTRPWCYLITEGSFSDSYPVLVASHGSVAVRPGTLSPGDDAGPP